MGKSKRKLVRLQNELNDQFQKLFDHKKLTNGQPMNDKRNGRSWFNQQEKIENKIQSLREEIKQQEKQVEKLERQEELKEMGYNKYGGLDMTIENIQESKKKSNALKKVNRLFSRHDPKIPTEIGNIRTAERKIRKRKRKPSS